MECYSCELTGHFEGSTACKPAGYNAKARRERALNQMEEGNKGDSIDQISRDFIRATGIPPKIDSWKEVPNKVPRGITGQTNQATAICSSSSNGRSEDSRVVQLKGEVRLL